jgi:hypothetical protein
MTSKTKKRGIEEAAETLADLAMRHLVQFSPEEQERRIAAMETRLARARRDSALLFMEGKR